MKCKHGEFDPEVGCPKCIAEVHGTLPPDVAAEKHFELPEETEEPIVLTRAWPIGTALIDVEPAKDIAVQQLYSESCALRTIALGRVITTNEELAPATEDLSLIAKMKKSIEEKRKEYVNPIREHLDAVNTAFKEFLAPLDEADKVTRSKILDFRNEQDRKRREAEAIEREKMELAQREAELKGGEITVDLTPVEKPDAVPDKVHTDLGSQGYMKIKKWEIEDFAAVPDDFKMIDAGKVTKLVKAGIGSIAGIRIWEEETLRINTR